MNKKADIVGIKYVVSELEINRIHARLNRIEKMISALAEVKKEDGKAGSEILDLFESMTKDMIYALRIKENSDLGVMVSLLDAARDLGDIKGDFKKGVD